MTAPAGLLIYGIPELQARERGRRAAHQAAGRGRRAIFILNFEVGRDATLADLRARHDAILIATGVYKARELEAPGVGLKNVFAAHATILIAPTAKAWATRCRLSTPARSMREGKNVVVIGGGDTAMDCVRTAVRQGAKSVSCLYRRDRDNMPGSLREVTTRRGRRRRVHLARLAASAFHGDERRDAACARSRMRLGCPMRPGARRRKK